MNLFTFPFVFSYLFFLNWNLLARAHPAPGCVPWRLEPTDDPLQDIRDAIPRASDGKQIGDLSTAISVMIGINALKGNLPAGVNENDGRDIIIKKSDLEFARNDIEHTSIWPVIIHEALKAIDEETRPDNTLLIDMGYREKTFDCQRANAPYLCRVSDMVSRLTGVRMHTTAPILKSKTPQNEIDIEHILNGATGGIGMVFDRSSPRYLMQYSADNSEKDTDAQEIQRNDRKNEDDKKRLRELYTTKEFHAAHLDIEKYGEQYDATYEVYGFGTGKFSYDTLMDRGQGRDIRLVVPY